MPQLTDRTRTIGLLLLVLITTFGWFEVARAEGSLVDIAAVSTLAVLALAALVILLRTSFSLRASTRAGNELSRRLSQQQAVARLGQLALTDVPQQGLFDEAARMVAEELDADLSHVLELDRSRQSFTIRAGSGEGIGLTVPSGLRSHAGYTAQAGQSVIMADIAREDRFEISAAMRALGITSGVSTPIGSNGDTYGVLGAYTRRAGTFCESDMTFLEAVANVLASAICRRAAERNAEEAHLVFEAVIEGTSDVVFVKDLEGRLVTANRRAADSLGHDAEWLIGRQLSDLLPAEYADHMTRTDELVLQRGRVETFEETVPTRHGMRVVLMTKGPYRARDGTVLGTFGIAHDITNRKAREQELADSEERLRLAQEGARMGTWDVDVLTGVTTWSAGLRALYGVEPDYPAGPEHLEPLVHPEDRRRFACVVAEAHARGEGFEFEFRIVRPDGTLRWVLARASAYHADDGTLIRILGVAADITERKLAEEALVQRDEMLQLAQDAARLGAWDWNLETNELQWTPAVYTIFGLDPTGGQPTYEAMLEHVHPDDREGLDADIGNALASGDSFYSGPCRVVQPSGAVRWVINRGTIVRSEDGVAKRLIGITLDDTERGQVEARLREAEKLEAIGRLAGGIAHDFNNLLVGIRGFGELALSRLERGERGAAADIDGVLSAADRAAALTRQLLAFGRRQVLTPAILDLTDVVQETADLLRRLLGGNVELVTRLAPYPVVVRADRSQLDQVITNLAINGRDAMPGGGVLTICVDTTVEAGTEVARLTVTDEGSGIDPDTAAQIFEPFFTTKGERGTGLGLATVHGIVAQSGGQVLLDTELGRGTTFEVHLPLASGHSVASAAAAPASKPGSETILVVEDDPSVRAIVTRMLETLGYDVVHAVSGEQAIERFGANARPIPLVVSDVMMRGVGGYETIDRIRKVEPTTKVLYMSGYLHDSAIDPERLDPGTGFIQKPFSSDQLGARIRRLLDEVAV